MLFNILNNIIIRIAVLWLKIKVNNNIWVSKHYGWMIQNVFYRNKLNWTNMLCKYVYYWKKHVFLYRKTVKAYYPQYVATRSGLINNLCATKCYFIWNWLYGGRVNPKVSDQRQVTYNICLTKRKSKRSIDHRRYWDFITVNQVSDFQND